MLTPSLLKAMIVAANNNLQQKSEYLNSINVFPVADGDTGTNMRMTLHVMNFKINELKEVLTFKSVSTAIQQGAFEGGKGNSGIILSQFFKGFTKLFMDKSTINTQEFATALDAGAKQAYKAVMNPREGTILTVMRRCGEIALETAEVHTKWPEFMQIVFRGIQDETKHTIDQLDLLKESNVVDSGALGFLYIFMGFLEVIQNNHIALTPTLEYIESMHANVQFHDKAETLKFRFCTEAHITDCDVEETIIQKKLDRYGDSLMVISPDNIKHRGLKLHIHSNDPDIVIKLFANYGKLEYVKVDDMLNQKEYTHNH